ncbi:MarR family transcriptional regulator [Nocardia sp. NBC_00508]|uniref:MarR family winged helix-turn-helix transcriptional regulator n=1 Tax=Nocardia sp. NBC_00508 TaxID=2975992 RepID=UPI002E806650|nr:MarR family transcriptional regulator [Nocardia sp. NBC_00508]WUD65950.1 MarR family transcriptional regulator [Nocardia sp. NBC_00508]
MDEPTPDPAPYPPARLRGLTSWLLNHAAARSKRVVAAKAGHRPGVRMRYAILAGLTEYGPLSQAELCRRLGIDRGDAVSALNSMEREGVTRRIPDPTDGRRNIVEITSTGTKVLLELDAVVNAAQNELLRNLTEQEQAQLNALLLRLIDVPAEGPN